MWRDKLYKVVKIQEGFSSAGQLSADEFVNTMMNHQTTLTTPEPGSDRALVERASRLRSLALSARAEGDHKQARALCRQSLDTLEAALGTDNPGLASTLNSLARIHEERGEYTEAEPLYRRAILILDNAGRGIEAEKLLCWSLGNLANLYRMQGHYPKAEPLFLQALGMAEQIFGPGDMEVSSALNNLAVLYKYMGRFTEAGPLYQRALSITEKALGRDHAEVATLYHNLGGLEHAAGNYLRGEPFARRALDIRERVLGPDHPETAADAAALAALLDGQGQYEEAERLYRRALVIFETAYGPEHYEIAVNLNNLAAIAHARGRNQEAEQLFQRALAIKERALGPEHPDVAMTLNNLAVFYKSCQNYDRAESLYQRALSISERALGSGHFKVAACLDNYARLLWKMGRAYEARELKARAKAILSGLGVRASKDVVATATVNPQFACFAMSVRTSGIHRWGVFAEEQIPAERQVIEYTGERILNREAKRRPRSRHYLFTLDKQWVLDGAVGGSGAELINHSCEPNLCSRLIKGRIFYFSNRLIEAGEELTADYSFAPDPRPQLCLCGSSKCRGTINTKPEQTAGKSALKRRP